MRVTVTLRSGDRERDVEVQAEVGASVEQLRPLFADLMAEDGAATLFSAGRPLSPTALLGDPGLRSGCMITMGVAGRARPSPVCSTLQLRVVGGPDSGQLIALPRGRHLIGRADHAELRLDDPDVSRQHAELEVGLHGVSVRDLGSTNGTWLAGASVTSEPCAVELGAVLVVGGSRLCVQAVSEPPAAVSADGEGGLLVHRPPRIRATAAHQALEFPAEPAAAHRPRLQWLTALPPAVFGVGCAVLMHNNQFLAFALLSPLTVLTGTVIDRRHWRRGNAEARASHARAEAAARVELDARLAAERSRRHRDFPDAAAVLQAARLPDCRLWERRPGEPGFLHVRLGTADQAADTTASRSGRPLPPEVIPATPATLSLSEGPLGLAGPLPLVRSLARWVLGQLLALHSPRDLSVVALLDGDITDWRWLRWVPAAVKAVETEPDGHRSLLHQLAGIITERRAQHPGGNWAGPRIVLLLDRASGVAGLEALGWVLEQGPAVGVTAVSVDEEARLLPPSCRSTAVLGSDTGAVVELRETGRPPLRAAAERVSPRWADQLARSLAPLRDSESTGASELPSEVWLADLLDDADLSAWSLMRRWAVSAAATAPIGMAANGPVEIDLLRDGPHVLIAGSTGSGKSELLRSLVTGLAARHAPDDVAFVLIDYKGGAAFAECAEFPHTLGLVTDLDGHLTSRALTSLSAEIRRRETAFAEAGVADLDDYRRSPLHSLRRLPRLVLVVDEFAYLAEELPNFLSGLIGIAQRGRSLGLHLVLATQRPAGVVSAQIRANMPLRIALRVTEAAESHDVLGSDVAHRIPKNRPGRGFARLADGLIEFQTARTGQRTGTPEPITVATLNAWNRPSEPTAATGSADDVPALRAAMLEAVATLKRPLPERPWLAPLPPRLATSELGQDPAAPFDIRFGLIDDPGRQRQIPISHDLTAGGSIGVIGGPRSGRTSALHTFLGHACSRLGPDQLHVYVLDCSGHSFHRLSGLPHCGAVVTRDDPASVARLTARLVEEVGARQRLLAGLGVRSLAEAHDAGTALPVVVVALDGWEGFTALSDDYDAGRSVDALLRVLRDGAAVGITVLIAGDRAMLGLRIAPLLGQKLLLALTDRNDYASAGLSAACLPSRFGPGRAVRAGDGLEIQLAVLADEVGSAVERGAHRATAADSTPGSGGPAIRLRSLPASVRRADLALCPSGDRSRDTGGRRSPGHAGDCLLGVGGDDAYPVWARLFVDHARFLISGPPQSGRSTTAVAIAGQALLAGLPILVAAPLRSPLAAWAGGQGLDVLTPDRPERAGEACDTFTGQVVLIDDAEEFTDTASGNLLAELAASHRASVIAAARSDDLAASFRGPAAAVRRHRTGLLLHPRPADGDLLGIRIGPSRMPAPPGRGLLVTDTIRRSAPDGLALQVAV